METESRLRGGAASTGGSQDLGSHLLLSSIVCDPEPDSVANRRLAIFPDVNLALANPRDAMQQSVNRLFHRVGRGLISQTDENLVRDQILGAVVDDQFPRQQ